MVKAKATLQSVAKVRSVVQLFAGPISVIRMVESTGEKPGVMTLR